MNESSNLFREKDTAILNIILNHILSGRERLGSLASTRIAGFSVAAGDTAIWFAGEKKDYEDKIYDYLAQRCAHHPRTASSTWAVRLTYGRNVWPIDTEPSAVARDMIEGMDLSKSLNASAMDYLGLGSSRGILDDSGTPVQVSGSQPHEFGYALVIAYATDGSGMIVDRINKQRERVGVAPLTISVPLREMARKYIGLTTADEAGQSLSRDVRDFGYLTEGWQAGFDYIGAHAKLLATGETPIFEEEVLRAA